MSFAVSQAHRTFSEFMSRGHKEAFGVLEDKAQYLHNLCFCWFMWDETNSEWLFAVTSLSQWLAPWFCRSRTWQTYMYWVRCIHMHTIHKLVGWDKTIDGVLFDRCPLCFEI